LRVVVQRVLSWYEPVNYRGGLSFRDAKQYIVKSTYSDMKRLIIDVIPAIAQNYGVIIQYQDYITDTKTLKEPTQASAVAVAEALETKRKEQGSVAVVKFCAGVISAWVKSMEPAKTAAKQAKAAAVAAKKAARSAAAATKQAAIDAAPTASPAATATAASK
jgi:hypothetical protein